MPPSYDTTYVDPPLGGCVTTPSDTELVKAFEATSRLDERRNLSAEIPERPYFSKSNFLREFEQYYAGAKKAQDALTEEYASLLLLGGSGPIIDMVNNQRVHDLILGFYQKNLPIGAICYRVAPLVFTRDFNLRKPIIAGKHVTGHCIEYDYHDGTGFLHTDLNMGPPPYVLEYLLADAVGPTG